jgi:hypothetical protein
MESVGYVDKWEIVMLMMESVVIVIENSSQNQKFY